MFELPDLPYNFSALEPHIDAQTMELHHSKHHATYVKNLNDALQGQTNLLNMPIEELIQNLDHVPEDVRAKVRNNGGGHANHSMFWQTISPHGGGEPKGPLMEAIKASFGDFASFQKAFGEAALARFGSGWAWLACTKDRVVITSTANQDSPLMEGQIPLLGLDVWEHAYYLNYQNRRPDYKAAWWNVVNWDEVAKLYQQAL